MQESKNPFINIKSIHIIGWACYFALLFISYSSISPFDTAFLRALQNIVVHVALFYVNSLVLIPKLMKKGQYFVYFVSVLALIALGIFILYYLNVHLRPFGELVPEFGSGRPRNPNFLRNGSRKQISETAILTRSLVRNISSISTVVLLSIVSKLFSQKLEKEKREESLQREQLLSEMKFLKSQVNPHFLFNALNNIYALVYTKNDLAPSMLMKLSDMLRYMLYESTEEKVVLEKEIDYITNFIELQQLKTEQNQNITFDFSQADETVRVPSLMLIPFIENSFKHSKIEDAKNGWIKIILKANKEEMEFTISNSIPSVAISKDKTGGIGLENVKRRLELLYHNNYDLNIEENENKFCVKLKINFE